MTPLGRVAISVCASIAMSSCAPSSEPRAEMATPAGAEEAALVRLSEALLDAINRKDEAAILALVDADGGLTGVAVSPAGERRVARIDWRAYARRVAGSREAAVERQYDPLVRIDGDLGMSWARYDVRIDGRITQCGFNQFDFVRQDEGWKIASITFNRRTTGCIGQ